LLTGAQLLQDEKNAIWVVPTGRILMAKKAKKGKAKKAAKKRKARKAKKKNGIGGFTIKLES